ncbi:MAG: hypothetical protein M1497_09965 [Nitrospirae bacterium]|nr:hypothetical protein [Nitrospirota bacterium]
MGGRPEKGMLRHAFLLMFTVFSAVSVFAAENHCARDEQIIFSCGIKGSSKVLSVCGSGQLAKDKGYVQYRFGAPGKIEFEYPSSREKSQIKFTYSHYFRARVDRTEVGFKNGRYEYSVFSDYEGDVKPVVDERGVSISESPTGKERRLLCKGKGINHLGRLATVVPCAEEDSSGECQ